MRKLIVLPDDGNPYADELNCAIQRLGTQVPVVSEPELTVEYLEQHDIEVVISTGLDRHWYFAFKGMDIVSVTLGERDLYYDLADIVIDCKNENPKRYFVSHEHTICGNKDFGFEDITSLVRKLEWDSEFFGFNVAFLSCMHLTDTIYRRIGRFLHDQNIRLVEYLCNCHDRRSVQVAEDQGFRFTDIRLTFTRRLKDRCDVALPDGVSFARATEADIDALRGIAGGLYEDSRYIFDPHFDPARIDEFYRGWVEKGVRGQYDDECWCLYDQGKPFAFCSVRYLQEQGASIGLVGMDDTHQGAGLGKALMYCVFNMFMDRGVSNVTVVTQGRNYAAQNLYQSVGFRTKATQLWYHKWM